MKDKDLAWALDVLIEKYPYTGLSDILRVLNDLHQNDRLSDEEYERLIAKLAERLKQLPYG